MLWYVMDTVQVFQKRKKINMSHYTYLMVNLGSFIVPFLFSFHPKLNFKKHFPAFFPANFIIGAIFISWDIYFTQQGVWGFNSSYTLGINWFGLPIEEWMFFFCIPFACAFTVHCLRIFFPKKIHPQWVSIILHSVVALLLLVSFSHTQQAYTFWACLTTALFILYLYHIAKASWLSAMILFYPVLLIPFFIVNGILTGTGLDAPVVWYNPEENLRIRIGTIPIEDMAYGLELILGNLFLLEKFKTKQSHEVIHSGTISSH
jgi:lycopene cyclase domain-containing protein